MIFKKGANRHDWLAHQYFKNRKRVSNCPPIVESLQRAERGNWSVASRPSVASRIASSLICKSNGATRGRSDSKNCFVFFAILPINRASFARESIGSAERNVTCSSLHVLNVT